MYKLSNTPNAIIRIDDSAFIPTDPENTDYAAYLTWVSHGNVPAPADPIDVPEVTVVSMRQARLALLQMGLLTQVSNTISALTGDAGAAAQIEWEYATEVSKDSPLVASLSATIGLSDGQIDSLFATAATL